jgi:predicted lipoprotein with Yx(FWY)xxD motif
MHIRIGVIAVAAVVAAAASACGSSSASGGSRGGATKALVRTASNASLGATVLVDSRGMTLYSLSAERGGRFICTKQSTIPGGGAPCLSLWMPLTVRGGAAPAGIDGLGTVVRPDGEGRQVTYRGLPLYTFADDSKPGDVRGDGFKDIGTWLAARVAGSSPPPATSSGGPYGY